MAKVEGPLFSLRARGSIEKTLTFQTTKAGQIVKFYKIPNDPKTKSQLKSRDDFKKAAEYYKKLSQKDRQAWKVLTYDKEYTGYAGFIKICKSVLASNNNWINIKSISIKDITKQTAVIKAQSNEPVGIRIVYGFSPGKLFMFKEESEPFTKEKEITLTDLFIKTQYYFRLTVINTDNQYGETGIYKFKTTGE